MAVRWQFIEDHEHRAIFWAWRTVRGDETIESQSQRFRSYGAAVGDAIRHGFQPRKQHWIVVTPHNVTHFRPGENPVTLSTSDEAAAESAGWLHFREARPRARSVVVPARRRKPVSQ